jgi:hypothetical protein
MIIKIRITKATYKILEISGHLIVKNIVNNDTKAIEEKPIRSAIRFYIKEF